MSGIRDPKKVLQAGLYLLESNVKAFMMEESCPF